MDCKQLFAQDRNSCLQRPVLVEAIPIGRRSKRRCTVDRRVSGASYGSQGILWAPLSERQRGRGTHVVFRLI